MDEETSTTPPSSNQHLHLQNSSIDGHRPKRRERSGLAIERLIAKERQLDRGGTFRDAIMEALAKDGARLGTLNGPDRQRLAREIISVCGTAQEWEARAWIDEAIAKAPPEPKAPAASELPASPVREADRSAGKGLAEPGPHRSRSDRLVSLIEASGADFFRSADGRAFATLPDARTIPIQSGVFRAWLQVLCWQAERKAPGRDVISDVVAHCAGLAIHEGKLRPVGVRVAPADSGLYLDLDGRIVVHVTANGWSTLSAVSCPVRMWRPPGLLELPAPERGGRLDELRSLLNPDLDDEAWMKLRAWMVATLHPSGPFPVLVLRGEQGTAKTWHAKAIRSVLDPVHGDVRAPPRDVDSLLVAAEKSWIVGIDNLSTISEWLSDALCRLATGGGLSKRTLYTDRDEELFDLRRPILANGIDPAMRADLLDRAYVVTLPVIPPEKRRAETDLVSRLNAARPRILAGLLDAVVVALGRYDTIKLRSLPRMADAARFAVAASHALGTTDEAMERVLLGIAEDAALESLEACVIADATLKLPADWCGSGNELLAELKKLRGDAPIPEGWPKNPRALSAELRRAAPAFRAVGIKITFPNRARKDRKFRVLRSDIPCAEPAPPAPEAPSAPLEHPNGADGAGLPFSGAGLARLPSSPETPAEWLPTRPGADGAGLQHDLSQGAPCRR